MKYGTFIRAFLVPVCLSLAACATTYAPVRLENPSTLDGAQVQSIGDVSVAVAILTDQQAGEHFGVDIASKGVQALWLSVRNGSERRLWFIRNFLDPDFYSADEVALLVHDQVPGEDFDRMRQHLRDETARVQMEPRTITEGFVFLPRHEGGRYADIRLAHDARESTEQVGWSGPASGAFEQLRFDFALPLPDGDFDYERMNPDLTYDGQELPEHDTGMLRRALENLPCCTTDDDGKNNGDPLNIVIVGEASEVLNSLSRSGWTFTHRITLHSIGREISAAVSGKEYTVAPVSTLYAFGRGQDVALQRSRKSIAQRNHLRLWLAPFRYEERPVWVGQVSRDIGIKITARSPSFTTHVIDPEVDLTREYLLHSLLAEGLVARFGFVHGSARATRVEPAQNLMGDPYFSDGLRLVIELSPHPIPYGQVRSFQWERSTAPVTEGQSEEALRHVRPIDP